MPDRHRHLLQVLRKAMRNEGLQKAFIPLSKH
ncbi:hypothetical protein J2739_003754 [Variovorax soli]|uniref:Uncharacterized protein n=1 Tax=Variovorax soli TaxID=376815 RepID=A0ABU1NHN8_9BURK|nr:hypothetical protein [Variovorax soli]